MIALADFNGEPDFNIKTNDKFDFSDCCCAFFFQHFLSCLCFSPVFSKFSPLCFFFFVQVWLGSYGVCSFSYSSLLTPFCFLSSSSWFVKLILTICIRALRSDTMVENHKLKNVEEHYKKLEERMQILQ